MTTVIREVRVSIRSEAGVLLSSQRGREMAAALGFDTVGQAAVATAILELARNIVQYAKTGEIVLRLVEQNGRRCVEVVARDEGPGIADIRRVLQGGYSTSGGLGAGVSGAKRLMDELEIVSRVGEGTTVTAKKWQR